MTESWKHSQNQLSAKRSDVQIWSKIGKLSYFKYVMENAIWKWKYFVKYSLYLISAMQNIPAILCSLTNLFHYWPFGLTKGWTKKMFSTSKTSRYKFSPIVRLLDFWTENLLYKELTKRIFSGSLEVAQDHTWQSDKADKFWFVL